MRPDRTGLLLLLVTVVGWGLSWPLMKLLLAELPPMTMRAAIGGIAVAVLAGIATVRGQTLAVPRAVWPRLVPQALLNISAWMGFSAFALLWLTTPEAITACSTTPVWAGLFAWVLLGERPTPLRLLALALGLAGLGILVAGSGLEVGLSKLPGVAVALAAAACFALGTVAAKRWPVLLPPPAAAAWQFGLGLLPMLAVALFAERPDFAALPAGTWAMLVFVGAGPVGLCYLAWFAAVRRLPAGAAAAGTLISPVVGVAAAAVMLGEPLGLRETLALGMTVGAVVLAVRG